MSCPNIDDDPDLAEAVGRLEANGRLIALRYVARNLGRWCDEVFGPDPAAIRARVLREIDELQNTASR